MVDLHLVSWNRPNMTRLVVEAINRNTSPELYNLHVFDNGSNAQAVAMLDELYERGMIQHLIKCPENKGLEYARQAMLMNDAHGEYFVCIDNDCLPPVGWLPKQMELMDTYEDFAAISQRTPVMIGTGNIFEQADETGMPIVDFPHPGGSFRMMRTNAVKSVDGWDRESRGRGSEERFICGKLREVGFGTAFATHIQCLHLFGDRKKTQERWGYEDGMKPEDSGHSDVWHPKLGSGDDYEEVAAYVGETLAKEYFNG